MFKTIKALINKTKPIFGFFQTLYKSLQALLHFSQTVDKAQAIFELQAQLITATTRLTKTQAKLASARQSLDKILTWEDERARYELHEIDTHRFVYRLRPQATPAQPVHYLCAPCFEGGHKSIIQLTHHSNGQNHYICPTCKFPITTGHYQNTPQTKPKPKDEHRPTRRLILKP